MTDPEIPDGFEFELEDVEPTLDLIALADSQDRVVELICNYRQKLRDSEFSEEACEVMTIHYHAQLRS